MRFDRLPPTQRSLPAGSPAPAAAENAALAPVGAVANVESDRRRSLRQEIEGIEAEAVGEFHGQERIAHQAHAIACQLAGLGSNAERLLRPAGATTAHLVDEEA